MHADYTERVHVEPGQRPQAVAMKSTASSIASATVISLMWLRSSTQIPVTAAIPSMEAM
jgi:hypothetical protein